MTTEDEWITIAQAAVIAGCSYQTARNRALRAHGKRKKEGARWYVRRSWAESWGVGRGGTTAVAQIEGLKARVKAAEKERDQAITARDKRAADHARQKKYSEGVKTHLQARLRNTTQILVEAVGADGPMDAEEAASKAVAVIEGLKTRLTSVVAEWDQSITACEKWAKAHARQKKEIEALKLECQTYADTYAESHPPAVIDRLVSAVESAPLQTLRQIDQPRHAALRRVVGLWTAVQHAVESFTPGDNAQQNNNNDDEVT